MNFHFNITIYILSLCKLWNALSFCTYNWLGSLKMKTRYVNLAVKWSFAWPTSLRYALPQSVVHYALVHYASSVKGIVGTMLCSLHYTLPQSTLRFTPPPPKAYYIFLTPTSCFASQRSFLRKANEKTAQLNNILTKRKTLKGTNWSFCVTSIERALGLGNDFNEQNWNERRMPCC